MRSGCQNTVDPHAEQKWKITSFPVSELRVKVFEAPLTTVTALRSKEAAMLNSFLSGAGSQDNGTSKRA
jgi:hypothetical protein